MTSSNASATRLPLPAATRPQRLPRAARMVLAMLGRLESGTLELHLPDGSAHRFGGQPGLHAELRVHDLAVFSAALRSGDIGLAAAYIAGQWDTPDLATLLQLFAANRRTVEEALYGSWAGRIAWRLRHLLRRNTRANSRRNIHAHYDLGNDFYALWLDPGMTYSSVLALAPGQSLQAAQQAKIDRAIAQCGLQAGEHLLEIGCGWGSTAETAARMGAQVTGITLSEAQLQYARNRLERAGLTNACTLRLQDYRDLGPETFDAIISIEMIEAVGQAWWETYFRTLHDRLKPGGRACIQSIVIDDALFDRYITGTDFIQQYIFPGGCLPCPAELRRLAEGAGLEITDSHAFGIGYADTLRAWDQRFQAVREAVRAQGFDEPFLRTWSFYLAYCEAGFRANNLDVVQLTLRRRDAGVPAA